MSTTGENYSITVPVTNIVIMNVFMLTLSKAYGKYRTILYLDSASWHTSGTLALPENIVLLLLPPYSPELNPTEHI